MTYDVGNTGPGLGQAQKCGGIEQVNGILIPNNMICKIMSISDIFTVRAVLGSGLSAVASSDGFYIDLTPPVFEPDAMSHMYYDVSQGEFTPVKYQASNNTIKTIWYCYDDQSMIKVCTAFTLNVTEC